MLLGLFPSRALALYVARGFFVRCAAMLAMLVMVLLMLDILSEAGSVLAHPGNGDAELWRYAGLRAPEIIARFLPFAILLGTLITVTQLNANSEVISMKAAGLSAHQILAPLLLVSALIAIVSFTFNERVATRAIAARTAWEAVDYGDIPRDSGVKTNVWVRDGEDLIHAAVIAGRGQATVLRDIEIFDRAGGNLVSILTAPRGRRDGDAWRLEDARRFDVARDSVVALGTIRFGPTIQPERFTMSSINADGTAYWDLAGDIEALKAAGRPTTALEGALWHKITGPLSTLLMPLLGAVAAFGIARSGKLFVRAVLGMSLGFAFFVADNFSLAMGDLGAYPPWLAAWAPFLLFFLVGETVLIRSEE